MSLRIRIILAIFAGILCSSNGRADPPHLAPLARGLNEVWPLASYDLNMTIDVRTQAGREVLHCRLENTSANTLKLNASALPWVTPNLFEFAALTAGGLVIYRTGGMEQLEAMPKEVSIDSGASMEGDIDVATSQIRGLSRAQDLLLVWSHGIGIVGSDRGSRLTGVTLLPKHKH